MAPAPSVRLRQKEVSFSKIGLDFVNSYDSLPEGGIWNERSEITGNQNAQIFALPDFALPLSDDVSCS